MPKAPSKLAQLVNWVRVNSNRKGIFHKSALYAFARNNDLERSALMFVWRCRQNGTMLDVDDDRLKISVSRGKSLEQFYKTLLKIVDKPVLEIGPEIEGKTDLKKQPETTKERKPEERIVEKEPSIDMSDLASAVAGLLNGELKRIDDRVTSLGSLVERGFSDLANNASLPRMRQLEQRNRQLENQLREFQEKAEAFDLIKRDAWEVVQALDIVEIEKDDLKKVIKKFL